MNLKKTDILKLKSKLPVLTLSLLIPVFILFFNSCLLGNTSVVEEKEEIAAGIEVEVVIEQGMTLNQIATVLEDTGVVDNGLLFRLYVQQKGKEKSLVPGIYNLLTGSEYEEVMNELILGPPVVTYKVAIPEGFTVRNIIEKFSSELPFINLEEMKKAVKIDSFNYDYLKEAKSLEGFLFPKTYEVVLEYSAFDIIEMMLAQYRFETRDLDYAYAQNKDFFATIDFYSLLIVMTRYGRLIINMKTAKTTAMAPA